MLNPALTYIRHCNFTLQTSLDVRLFARALSGLRWLEHQKLYFYLYDLPWEDVLEALLYSLSSSIKTLEIYAISCKGRHSGALSMDFQVTHTSIKTHGSRGVEQLGLLFKHCPALMTFDSPYESKKDLQAQWTDVAREIAANCRGFQELTGSGQGTVAILEHIRMDALRRLVSGSFGDSEIARTFELIAIRQSNSLTEIRLVHVHHVRGTALQAILWTCARLEHLVIRGYESAATRLKHLVEKGWVCLRLKPLEITVDLRRRKLLAYIVQTWGQPMPCVNEAMSIMLQKFYRQIGALTEIQILNLKVKSKELM
ncbi:hypothetical protein BGX29_005633 [Mortierella sp. GBA35]|nr:hypothetical protein BGX29_005633 [Mortierella sp. GBA35]